VELQNFDLLISMDAARRCEARVVRSPAGDSRACAIAWPFDEQQEYAVLAQIYGELLMRRAHVPDQSLVKDYGTRLFQASFCGPIMELYAASLVMTRDRRQGLRLRLQFDGDQVLHRAAWEFLYDPERRRFVAANEASPLVRYLPLQQPVQAIAARHPLRVLVAIAAPVNESRLQVAHEWEILNHALRDAIQDGTMTVTLLDGPCTFDRLRDTLRAQPVEVLHFIGHGEPGVLILESETRQAQRIDVETFCEVFPHEGPPRLIVLNACAGAVVNGRDGFHSVTQGLVQHGAAAVIAMQAAITDQAALMFAQYFYRELARTGAVDRAITEARLRLRVNNGPVEWGTPVLYMRSPDGQLFEPAAGARGQQESLPPPPPPPPGSGAGHRPPRTPDPQGGVGSSTEDTVREPVWGKILILLLLSIVVVAAFIVLSPTKQEVTVAPAAAIDWTAPAAAPAPLPDDIQAGAAKSAQPPASTTSTTGTAPAADGAMPADAPSQSAADAAAAAAAPAAADAAAAGRKQ